jgi:hypothetical protein
VANDLDLPQMYLTIYRARDALAKKLKQ